MILRSFGVSIMILLSFGKQLVAKPLAQKTEMFFSLAEIKNAGKKELAPMQYIAASDGTALALRSYLPLQAKAVLIFYHGAGAHSGLSYNHLAVGLRDDFAIATYTPDLRGHGGSGGDRGDAPSDEQVWRDINSLITHVRDQHPMLPVFLGGHSGGAGLTLNYSSWAERLPLDGYLFLAPYLGYRSETSYDKDDSERYQFASINLASFMINKFSGGLLLGHSKAVTFDYPTSVLESNPEIVAFNTINMSKATTPYSPDRQLSALNSFGLWTGREDEVFDPEKVTRFAKQHSDIKAHKEIRIVNDTNHFSIILEASQLIGPWILGDKR